MRFKYLSISIMLITGIMFSASYADDAEKPSILGGKIWSGSDTLDLGKYAAPDSLESQKAREEEDFFSGDLTELPAWKISGKTEILQLKLSIPRGLKFLDEAPVVLKAKSSDPDVIQIEEGVAENPSKGFIFPITAKPGKADIYLYYRVVCCTTEDREACFFKEASLMVPVEVGDYEDDIIKIRHELDY